MEEVKRPAWLPDTKGFLAVAIIVVFMVSMGLIATDNVPKDPVITTLFSTMVGSVIALMKDVYSYVFGSSASASSKDESIQKMATAATTAATTATEAASAATVAAATSGTNGKH